ncbi:MAG: hypothetical protein H6815_07660 [Phycisphaeraceae bacterium]|nr:hypothetical protein [Phycisphaerales bacterium]MCB9860317.1 hypothetical protein [Phycisphaeraceae bacterium]
MMHASARRGSVLLEIVISVALFIAAGLTIFGSVRQSLRSAEGADVRAQAVDLASTAMAMLEAGLATPEMLNGPALRTMEHIEDASALAGEYSDAPMPESESEFDDEMLGFEAQATIPSVEQRLASTMWSLEIAAERSEFPGLHLVTVRSVKYATLDMDEVEASFELTQLVRLAPDAQDIVGEDGLNELAAPSGSSGGGL